MAQPTEFSFARYLAAKKTVDDRALHRATWDALAGALREERQGSPLTILEIGAGIGTMLERILAWQLLDRRTEYTAIDEIEENIKEALTRIPAWARAHAWHSETAGQTITLSGNGLALIAAFEAVDLFQFIQRERGYRSWDLVIAHAFLDLMNIPVTLPEIFSVLRPGGLAYFTINFDGATIFEPAIDPGYDLYLEGLYHRTMDERITAGQPSGDSQAGRHLFNHLRAVGADILAAGASDWVAFAGAAGYPSDEAYFLHFIVDTFNRALTGHPDLGDLARFQAWVTERHAQIERGELVYIAHQIDILARVPSGGGQVR